jgi:hypothetical protein
LQEQLGFEGYPYAEASAIKGDGVMETFKLVSKITAKHLYNRLKGKSEPIERKKPAAETPKPAKVEVRPEPEPEPEPEPLAGVAQNPFGDSMPFPDSAPTAGYEKMEEVSLEQLLSEGRERPATISGNVPIPVMIDEVEELGAAEIMPMEEPPVAVVLMDEPAPKAAPTSAPAGNNGREAELEAQIQQLEAQIITMRLTHREQLEAIMRSVGELSRTVHEKISS